MRSLFLDSLNLSSIPKLEESFHEHFPTERLEQIWQESEPRKYDTKITPWALVQAIMLGFFSRASGLRTIAERCGHILGTCDHTSLAKALKRLSSLIFVQKLVRCLEGDSTPQHDELVAIDSMANTAAATVVHDPAKRKVKKPAKAKKRKLSKREKLARKKARNTPPKQLNQKTVGGGVLWCYRTKAAPGTCPVQVLQVIRGAWHDTKIMRKIKLVAKGPIYLMDAGFYCLELLSAWKRDQVRFIVRVKKSSLVYEVLSTYSKRKRADGKPLLLDARVRLGGPRAKAHPEVRLVISLLTSGEQLILATSETSWTTKRILQAYRQRFHIERFHKLLKDSLGLAHLYSFDRYGMEFLLWTALFSALLLFHGAKHESPSDTILAIHQALRQARRLLNHGPEWKRNTPVTRRNQKKKKRSSKPGQTLPGVQTSQQ